MTAARRPFGVIGAGSWGTALAVQLARNGHAVRLWGRAGDGLESLARERRNTRYLPDAEFPPTLAVESDLGRVLAECADLLVVTPSHGLRGFQRCSLDGVKIEIGQCPVE